MGQGRTWEDRGGQGRRNEMIDEEKIVKDKEEKLSGMKRKEEGEDKRERERDTNKRTQSRTGNDLLHHLLFQVLGGSYNIGFGHFRCVEYLNKKLEL